MSKAEHNKENVTTEEKVMSTEKNTEMSTESTKEVSKKTLSKEEKKKLRRNAIDNAGRLYLDEADKEDGYVYRVCNLTPGNFEKYKRHGFEVVTHAINSGNGSLANPEASGKPTEFEVGGTASGSMKAIWIRATKEDYEIMKELEKDEADAQDNMIKGGIDPTTGQAFIPKENLIGKITKG